MWSFWSRRTETDSCESIEPLLPLYADRMASPEEMRRVDAHLPGCERCREALAWMQATHRALAARPIALPPADMHCRIAQAIAASAAPPLTPGLLRPVRSFAVRPAYAAAASLVVVGIALSTRYPLWHTQSVKPVPQPVSVASAPFHAKPNAAVPPPTVSTNPRVASATPKVEKSATRPVIVPRRTEPVSVTPPKEQVANAVPVLNKPVVPVRVKTDVRSLAVPHDKVASIKIAPIEKHQPQVIKALPEPKLAVTPKAPNAPLVARQDKELPSIPVTVRPFTVTPEAPPVQTASVQSRPKLDDFRTKLADCAEALRSAPLAPSRYATRQASSGAANTLQSLASEPVAYYSAIHSDTAIK